MPRQGLVRRQHNLASGKALFLLVALLSVVLTPVQTNAGTDTVHPHAMLQLVAEALHLTPDHTHLHDTGANDDTAMPIVVFRADHPHHHTEGDRAVTMTTQADPPSLKKQSLTMPVYLPTLMPDHGEALTPDHLFTILLAASDQAPAGHSVAPEPPPPRMVLPA